MKEQLEMLADAETRQQRAWRIASKWARLAKERPGCGHGRIALKLLRKAIAECQPPQLKRAV